MSKLQKADVIVVGAGLIGSSVAMHLAQKGVSSVRVIDFDLEGSLSSSELNAGGVRASWQQPINIQMAKTSIDYFSTIAQEVGYRDCGYLWLHSNETLNSALKARDRQMELGWPVEEWDVSVLRKKIDFLDKLDGIAGALFAPRDGLINPNLLKNHFRSKARQLGVNFDDRTLLRKAEYKKTLGNSQITLLAERFPEVLSEEDKASVLKSQTANSNQSSVEYQAQYVINCAGPWASHIAQILGYPCPSYPVRRQVCIFDCRDVDLSSYGMIVDTSGVYFHPEASNGLAGFAVQEEPSGMNYTYDGESFFMNYIWPALYERSTRFERLKHVTGWAGLYEVSPDETAILGQVTLGEAGESSKVFEAHSFSGHGVMHSYAAGLLLAEKIALGKYQTIDADLLSGNRFENGKQVREGFII